MWGVFLCVGGGVAMIKSLTLRRMLRVFFLFTEPTSSIAKPVCMKNTEGAGAGGRAKVHVQTEAKGVGRGLGGSAKSQVPPAPPRPPDLPRMEPIISHRVFSSAVRDRSKS